MARTVANARSDNDRVAIKAPQGEMASPVESPPVLSDSLPASISIPLDVHGVILDELLDEKEFLLQFRLLSKSLLRVATPRAFRRLSVWCTGAAARKRGYFNVANTPRLAVYVKEIIWRERTGKTNASVMQAFSDSIADIFKFPNVHTLRFWFPTTWNEPLNDALMSPTRQLQIRIFDDLANLYLSSSPDVRPKTTPKVLEIRGLITMPNESLRSDAFKTFVQPIETLILSKLVNKDDDFTHHSDEDYSAFLRTDLTGLLNSARNLTSLTLECDVIMLYDWSEVGTLLNLRHLKLKNFIFSPQFNPEEFILRHKASMEQLDLVDCSIDTDPELPSNAPERVWKDVFETFERELVGLEDAVFEPLPGIDDGDPKEEIQDIRGYVYFYGGEETPEYVSIYDVVSSPLQGDGEADRSAYESWQKAIKTRLLGALKRPQSDAGEDTGR